jgi:hypothetical protein
MGAICSSSHSGVSAHKETTFLSIFSNLQDFHATSYLYSLHKMKFQKKANNNRLSWSRNGWCHHGWLLVKMIMNIIIIWGNLFIYFNFAATWLSFPKIVIRKCTFTY